jgi:hypothetical protein
MNPSGILAGGGGSRHGSAAAAAATVGRVVRAAGGAYGAGRPWVAGAGRFQSSILAVIVVAMIMSVLLY